MKRLKSGKAVGRLAQLVGAVGPDIIPVEECSCV